MVLYSNVDNILGFLGKNYQLLVAIGTLITLVVNMLKNSVDMKKSFKELNILSKENKTTSKVLFENQLESSKELKKLVDTIVEVVNLSKEVIDDFDELKKMFVLLLQVANIPIHSKEGFLTALNEKGNKGLELALKGLETQINTKIEQDNTSRIELDEEIDNLDRV